MKRLAWFAVIALSASISSVPLAAQSSTPVRQQPKFVPPPLNLSVWSSPGSDASGCPISMHASQIGGGATIMVDNDGHRHPISRGLHLSLTDPLHTATIASAELTVHGLNGKPHTVQSGPVSSGPVSSGLVFRPDGSSDPWEMTRNLNVKFGPGEDHRAETDLAIDGFASVTWIRLDSLTLSDGTVWAPRAAVACRTAPDPFMLVSAK